MMNTDGSKYVEEEKLDMFGQKSLVKTRVSTRGDHIIEEFKIVL
jgi:hypothetical protein